MKADKENALSGLRVLDLSRVLAGPWSTQLLGDLGADVVKVERPGSGDDTRSWGPPWLKDVEGRDTGDAAYYSCANRNKRSLALDLSTPGGQDLVRQLATKADVLVENFKVGGLNAYGLDYESLRALNPRLIYCSVTGFGQTGPYAARPGYDFLMQGMGGLMSLTGHPDDAPGGGPIKVGVALTDIVTGMYAAVAVLAALAFRERTGQGQHIDLALLDVQVATLANQAANYLVGDRVPSRMGNAHPNIVPYQDFPTSDGHMIVTVGNDAQFASFCRVLGHPHWETDARFASNAQRVRHRAELEQMISFVTRTRPTDEWIAMMETAGVPCGPINTLDKVFENPQIVERGMRVAMPDARGGTISLVANPMRLSASPVDYRHPPPLLGQHTPEVLRSWLGLTDTDVARLRDQGVI